MISFRQKQPYDIDAFDIYKLGLIRKRCNLFQILSERGSIKESSTVNSIICSKSLEIVLDTIIDLYAKGDTKYSSLISSLDWFIEESMKIKMDSNSSIIQPASFVLIEGLRTSGEDLKTAVEHIELVSDGAIVGTCKATRQILLKFLSAIKTFETELMRLAKQRQSLCFGSFNLLLSADKELQSLRHNLRKLPILENITTMGNVTERVYCTLMEVQKSRSLDTVSIQAPQWALNSARLQEDLDTLNNLKKSFVNSEMNLVAQVEETIKRVYLL